MMTTDLLPTPQTTLVVLLGASDYPEAHGFNNQAFAHSAAALHRYVREIYGVPEKNICALFESDASPSDQEKYMGHFLETRIATLQQSASPARDVILYYVGHGGFSPANRYHVFVRHSKEPGPPSTKLAIESLANTLKESARYLRRFVLLDTCFAASAQKDFSAPQDVVAARQIIEAFHEIDQGRGFPPRGTSLLCATNQHDPAVTPEGARLTAFTEALLKVLTTGDPYQPDKPLLSLRTVHRLMVDILTSTYQTEVPRPEIHSPDQSKGDVADVPFFPNPAYKSQPISTSELLPAMASPVTPIFDPSPTVTHSPRLVRRARMSRRTLLLMLAGAAVAATTVVLAQKLPSHNTDAPNTQKTPSARSTVPTPSARATSATETFTQTPVATQYDITALAWSPKGQLLASGSTDATVQIHNISMGIMILTIHVASHVQSVAWSPDGTKIASGHQDGSIQVWNAATGHLIASAAGTGSPQQRSLSWSPDNTKIVSTGAQIWDATSGTLLFAYADAATGCPVAWSPDGTSIATGGVAAIDVWNATSGQRTTQYPGGSMGSLAWDIAWSPHGTYIAASYITGTLVNVWDTKTGQLIAHYGSENEGRSGNVLSWSPDSTQIVSEDQNGSMQRWNATTGTHIQSNDTSAEVTCVAWSFDGTTIASGGLLNKTVQYWKLPS